MSTNRVKIDAPAGIIEVEGEKDFVEEQVDKLLPMISAAGFGSRPLGADASQNKEGGPHESGKGTATDEKDSPPASRTKRRVSRPPQGQSCRDRIKILRSDGFFSEHRGPKDIVGGLAKKGWTYKTNQVGATLTQMFEKGEIQRTKEGKTFKYFWDRET